jgi:hypothetical protein
MNAWFCGAIVTGLCVGLCTNFVLVGKPNDSRCISLIWLPSVAFILVFGYEHTRLALYVCRCLSLTRIRRNLSFKVYTTWKLMNDIATGRMFTYKTKQLVIWMLALSLGETVSCKNLSAAAPVPVHVPVCPFTCCVRFI